MTTIILLTLALTLLQIWLLPLIINFKDMAYLVSNRDEERERSALSNRVSRASSNLQESLPAFLALCLLSMIVEVDVTATASVWLGLRVVYLACYSIGIPLLRSGIWVASVLCMVSMALQLA